MAVQQMKVFWTVLLLVGVSVVLVLSLFFPEFLANNKFLSDFITFQIMYFLIVIVTITFASVANIHLWITKSQTSIIDVSSRARIEEQFAKPLRAETASSAWLLFWALIACTIALIVKGGLPNSLFVCSAVNGVGVLVLVTNAIVLHDIYSTVFALIGINGQSNDADINNTPEDPR